VGKPPSNLNITKHVSDFGILNQYIFSCNAFKIAKKNASIIVFEKFWLSFNIGKGDNLTQKQCLPEKQNQ
jgi:hypothetical protein